MWDTVACLGRVVIGRCPVMVDARIVLSGRRTRGPVDVGTEFFKINGSLVRM